MTAPYRTAVALVLSVVVTACGGPRAGAVSSSPPARGSNSAPASNKPGGDGLLACDLSQAGGALMILQGPTGAECQRYARDFSSDGDFWAIVQAVPTWAANAALDCQFASPDNGTQATVQDDGSDAGQSEAQAACVSLSKSGWSQVPGDSVASASSSTLDYRVRVDASLPNGLPGTFEQQIANSCGDDAARKVQANDWGRVNYRDGVVTISANHDHSVDAAYTITVRLEIVAADGSTHDGVWACYADSNGKTEVDGTFTTLSGSH